MPVDWSLYKLAKPGSIEWWQYRVAGSVQCCVGQVESRDTMALIVGKMCYEAEQRGENCCVWHQHSIHLGQLDRCPCMPCEEARKNAKEPR